MSKKPGQAHHVDRDGAVAERPLERDAHMPSERKVAADGDYVLARYNLACAASLAGDTAKAAAQLR